MRKQAEQLVVGRVYADIKEGKHFKPAFMRFEGKNSEGFRMFSYVAGDRCYVFKSETCMPFSPSQKWYELTPEEDAIYNKPSATTDGWVKCSDRLPDNDREVMIYVSNDIVQAYCKDGKWKGSMLVRDNMNDGYVHDATICIIDSHFNFVTHWRELPEPPQQ